jgi:hypothetical protein
LTVSTPDGAAGTAAGAAGDAGTGADDAKVQEDLGKIVNDDKGKAEAKDGKSETDKRSPAEEIEHWKTQARKQEARARDNAAKAKAHDDYVESQKTEQQKLADRANEAEQRATEAEAAHHRLLAAANNDLPPELVDVLGTGTEDDINARAEAIGKAITTRVNELLAAARNGQAPRQTGNGRPVEQLTPGASPGAGGTPMDNNGWFREMLGNSRRH